MHVWDETCGPSVFELFNASCKARVPLPMGATVKVSAEQAAAESTDTDKAAGLQHIPPSPSRGHPHTTPRSKSCPSRIPTMWGPATTQAQEEETTAVAASPPNASPTRLPTASAGINSNKIKCQGSGSQRANMPGSQKAFPHR